jgi:hypothetical protein
MDIPKAARNGIGLRTVSRQEEQLETGLSRQPLHNRLGLVKAIGIDNAVDFVEGRVRVPPSQRVVKSTGSCNLG